MSRPLRLGRLAAAAILALPGAAPAADKGLVLACELVAPPAEAVVADAVPAGEVPADAVPAEAVAALPPPPAFPGFAIVLMARGAVEITDPDGVIAPGVAASPAGPFAWTVGTVLNTLTVKGRLEDGRAAVLWHRLNQAQTLVPPAGMLTQLICEVS